MDTLLRDLLAIFAVSVAVLWVSHKLRLPSVVGFLLTGVVAGPHGIGLVRASQQVETLAEIGVVLLLFTIGLELSFERVARAGRALLVGGPLQVVLTTVAVAAVAVAWRVPLPLAILAGLLVSLSSTAIVLRVLQDRAELDTPHGRTIMGALIFQDLAFLPMMLALPFLAGGEGAGAAHLLRIAGGVLALVLVLFAGRWVVPRLLFQVATIRSREAFLLAILVLGLGIAWLGSQAGLSLSLGAFLAGLLLSESEYAHEALASTASLRDLFTSFFFVSVGMLLDLAFVATHLPVVAAVTLGVLLLKIGPAALAAAAAGLPLRSAVLSALALAQVGEFSFVLAGAGLDAGLLEGHAFQLFIAISVLTMVLTPFVISAGSLPLMLPGRRWREERGDGAVVRALPRDQLLIVGFGLNGRNLAHAARHAGIPYTVLEMNAATVRSAGEEGEPIHYGDATRPKLLELAGVAAARVIVVAISDSAATRQIVVAARRLNATAHIIARTRYTQEIPALRQLGADDVIPEEFETSVEIFTRVLRRYLVPEDEIAALTRQIRADTYELLRELAPAAPSATLLRSVLPDAEVCTLRIEPGSALDGTSLADAELRPRHGVTVLALRRDAGVLPTPAAEELIRGGDALVVLGPPEGLAEVARLARAEASHRVS